MNPAIHKARQYLLRRQNDQRLRSLARAVEKAARIDETQPPVVFFNASTRLGGVSLNAAFAALSAMALQLEGVPVRYFACRAGLERCTLGVVVNGPENPPPCATCIDQSEALFGHAPARWFEFEADADLRDALANLSVEELESFVFDGIPLGLLTLPSIRWSLRIHHLPDDEGTRALFQSFILSAHRVVREFRAFVEEIRPRRVVVFNGISYPESCARWVANTKGIHVITHEVAHQPLTAFFSHKHVTAYPVKIPRDFELDEAQNARLDAYLAKRFQGDFTMAGLKFWPEMKGLDKSLLERIGQFRQMVPVFSNVIFDTAQLHANVIFDHMFAWLDQVLEIMQAHPDTLFVLRAHPDELRPDSRKQARETVDQWVLRHNVEQLPNVVYVRPREYLSSYALVQRAKFVMAYNSTIGLEAALMGKPVLNGGKARYTQYPIVYLPRSAEAHREMAEEFLTAPAVEMPEKFLRNARRFQYYQLWKTPLPFDDFLEPHPTRGYVNFKNFGVDEIRSAPALRVIVRGILENDEFLMPG